MQKNYLYLTLAVVSLIVFKGFIPDKINVEYSSILMVLFGILFTSLMAGFISNTPSIYNRLVDPDKGEDGEKKYYYTIIVVLLVSFGLQVGQSEKSKKNLLDKYGVETVAKVEDGEQIMKVGLKGSRTNSKITITYFDQEGEKISTEVQISDREFDDFFLNQELKIKYLPDNKTIVQLI